MKKELCFICGNKATNKNIAKDNHYFCGNNCESVYWNIRKLDIKKQRLVRSMIKWKFSKQDVSELIKFYTN